MYLRQGTNWSEQAKLTPSRGSEFERFGSSVAISGDTAVVGANRADRLEQEQSESGASYVYARNGSSWTEQARLTTSDGLTSDWLGTSVAIDRETIVVGAFRADLQRKPDSGGAYVFRRRGSAWVEQAKLLAGDPSINDRLGCAVSISGETVLAGALGVDSRENPDVGAACVFALPPATVSSGEARVASVAAGDPGEFTAIALFQGSFQTSGSGSLLAEQPADEKSVRITFTSAMTDRIVWMRISGPNGAMVRLQVTSDLRHWTELTTTTLDAAPFHYRDAAATGAATRFYRVVLASEESAY